MQAGHGWLISNLDILPKSVMLEVRSCQSILRIPRAPSHSKSLKWPVSGPFPRPETFPSSFPRLLPVCSNVIVSDKLPLTSYTKLYLTPSSLLSRAFITSLIYYMIERLLPIVRRFLPKCQLPKCRFSLFCSPH